MDLVSFCSFLRVPLQDRPVWRDVSLDSVAIELNDVNDRTAFFALCHRDYADNYFNGPNVESIRLVAAALEKGAPVCVVRKDAYELNLEWLFQYRERLVIVEDVIVALQRLAKEIMSRSRVPIIAVTGSAGKTTTKDLIARVLSDSGRAVLCSEKNKNNGLGLPLTAVRILKRNYDTAVLEMGMSTPGGEIRRLCGIASPDIAIVLNVLPVHLEHLKTLCRIQEAKSEIVEGMNIGGTAVLNADDARVIAMRAKAPRVVTFGLGPDADVRATDIGIVADGVEFTLRHLGRQIGVFSHLRGSHNVTNMLAAAAACLAYMPSLTLDLIANSFSTFLPVDQRGREFRLRDDIVMIDDTYNSNPWSLELSAVSAKSIAKERRRLLVVAGGMRELGPETGCLHTNAGAALARAGVDILFSFGENSVDLTNGFESECSRPTFVFSDISRLATFLERFIEAGDVVLVKGSRAERLERLVFYLCRSSRFRRDV